jgi:hypothetical protein
VKVRIDSLSAEKILVLPALHYLASVKNQYLVGVLNRR